MRPSFAVVSALGVAQILGWGASYYLLAVLAAPIAAETGWPPGAVIGGVSLGLLVAGLVSRHIGRTIDRGGGRPVLAASAAYFAAGLAALALAGDLISYFVSWAIIGLGMGTGLYDAAFSTLGRLYGAAARGAITTLTLWGGFASTVCWPLSALMVESIGWRAACLVYATLHLAVVLPLHLIALPREGKRPLDVADQPSPRTTDPAKSGGTLFVLLAGSLTIGSTITSILAVHLLAMLQMQGVALGLAVALGALIGPSQVGARIVELAFGRHYHPIWTLTVSVVLMAGGLAILLGDSAGFAVAIVVYGSGLGIQYVARGTLPLALFGASGYPVVIGRLAMPSLLAQAAAPTVGALLIAAYGAVSTLGVLAALAAVNVLLVAAIWRRSRALR